MSKTSKRGPKLTPTDLVNAERVYCERTLSHFVRRAWHVLEPATPYVHGWHIDAICEHLEAITYGHIKNLLINVPPRHAKSLLCAVFWPAWTWTMWPATRWLFASYAQQLATRDSLKTRRLVLSNWYQEKWWHRVRLADDQAAKVRFENTKTGYRIATATGAMGTGEGGDIAAVDDPHSAQGASSAAHREATLIWWDETMSTRLNNPTTGAKLIIMQRLHEKDLSGHVLEQGGYEHLCLPAEFEPTRKSYTVIGWEDPRTQEGELLWPERMGDAELAQKRKELGSYGYAGQFQQRPTPRGGGMIQANKLQILDRAPPERDILVKVRYWDKAGTAGGGHWTAGVQMALLKDNSYCILDVTRGQWSSGYRESRIKQTAQVDGPETIIWIEEEGGSGGKESAENTVKNLAGFAAFRDKVSGDRQLRADPLAAQIENENVYLVKGSWNSDFIDEAQMFPVGEYDDQVVAASGAFNKLNQRRQAGPV